MHRKDLIREVSYRTGYTQIVCSEIIRELFDVITSELEAYGAVRIPNFGVFDTYTKKATNRRMPGSDELLPIDAKKYPRFMPAEELKNRVK